MFAILINEENLPRIRQSPQLTPQYDKYGLQTYLAQESKWYFITGYVDTKGAVREFAVLPQYILDDNFEYDATKIQTDWDQIVRK